MRRIWVIDHLDLRVIMLPDRTEMVADWRETETAERTNQEQKLAGISKSTLPLEPLLEILTQPKDRNLFYRTREAGFSENGKDIHHSDAKNAAL